VHDCSSAERRRQCGDRPPPPHAGGEDRCRTCARPPLTVRAENTAERASRTLNLEVRRDRAQDRALGARAADRARSTPALATSPGAREIDEDRAAVGPDVGRPEEFGRTPRSLRDTGYNFNLTR
jgi:hypothetical protein